MPRAQDEYYAWIDPDEVLEDLPGDETFFIGQGYEDESTTICCKKCKSKSFNVGRKSFNVGRGEHYTVIKCVNCDWQVCIGGFPYAAFYSRDPN